MLHHNLNDERLLQNNITARAVWLHRNVIFQERGFSPAGNFHISTFASKILCITNALILLQNHYLCYLRLTKGSGLTDKECTKG